ncbi:hypothetical protein SARC_00019 [Sphaeroforma arctica JP610]|uniref:Secreted protein n=1 Tax=Sphaeroforma arctica JP610 TaxID=667725 RepID=A0A0L0GFL8_9EUKA|nr:hypothetical protein SARC_00019 [Sphaeroforma arctica JP610]KNC87885.1 hypothetical protein SARC_00019 [Sphaeroforma arctica JP610]|eukprot:XP_014161787.1 hypothetical protein SARC_00019 [Sphaeroforma arctica JP610]
MLVSQVTAVKAAFISLPFVGAGLVASQSSRDSTTSKSSVASDVSSPAHGDSFARRSMISTTDGAVEDTSIQSSLPTWDQTHNGIAAS